MSLSLSLSWKEPQQQQQKKNQNENFIIILDLDYDTDEETDKLLGREHRIHAKNQAVRDAVGWSWLISTNIIVILNHFFIFSFVTGDFQTSK